MGLSAAEWERVEALLPDALKLPRADRARFLQVHCGDEAHLRSELESLIAAGEPDEGFLSVPVGVTAPTGPEEALLAPGTRLGPWKVGEKIGRGGMGEVYAAERADGQFEMDAALKILKRGLDTDELLRRFVRERNILARLSHPNIARLVDAGATDDHRPYYVMERVTGRSITSFCRERELGVREVLALMVRVCEAVDAAHRNLIVHRDLKPSNVLVTDAGEVKLLDFGVAKVMAEEGDGTRTRGQDAMLTPAYAAPEQILGGEVSTATDVYALGIMLFLLLTGRLPHQREGVPFMTVVANLRTESTERPSRIVARGPAGRLRARELAGDLDLIVLKALHADSQRRYRSAHDLGADLQRYLDRQPVEARPDSFGYRLGRLLQRHPLTSAAIGIAVLALVAGFGVAVWQAGVARAQARAAEKALATANAVGEFLNKDLLARADPREGPNKGLTVRDMLDRAATSVDARFRAEPLAAAQVHATLGQAYTGIGEYVLAVPQLEQAAKLYEREAGPLSPRTLDTQVRLADMLNATGRRREGCGLIETLRSRFREAGRAEDDESLTRLHLKSVRCRDDPADAAEVRSVVEDLERRRLTEGANYVLALDILSGKLFDLQDYPGSARVDAKLVAQGEHTLPPGHPSMVQRRLHYVGALVFSGKLAEADAQMKRAREDLAQWAGANSGTADNVDTWETLLRLEQGRADEAARLAAAGLRGRAGQRRDATRIAHLFVLGEARLLQGRLADAIENETAAVAYSTEMGVPKVFYEIPARAVWADALLKQGKVAQAREVLGALPDSEVAKLGPVVWTRALLLRTQGLLALKSGSAGQGRAALKESLDIYAHLYGPDHWRTRRAVEELAVADRA